MPLPRYCWIARTLADRGKITGAENNDFAYRAAALLESASAPDMFEFEMNVRIHFRGVFVRICAVGHAYMNI